MFQFISFLLNSFYRFNNMFILKKKISIHYVCRIYMQNVQTLPNPVAKWTWNYFSNLQTYNLKEKKNKQTSILLSISQLVLVINILRLTNKKKAATITISWNYCISENLNYQADKVNTNFVFSKIVLYSFIWKLYG